MLYNSRRTISYYYTRQLRQPARAERLQVQ